MTAAFQKTVNVQNAFGVPGELYDDGPVRAAPYELISASAAYNIIGATAFTVTSPDPGDNSGSAVAAAGGTGAFAGILMNSKVYATSGPSSGAIDPTLSLQNHTIAELLSMGDIIVQLPAPANIGDLVCYDNTTGKLSTYAALTTFTAAMSTAGVLSVTAVTAGSLQIGQVISGVGFAGVVITSLGSGTGNTGTYNTTYIGTAVASEAMSGPSLPPPAAAFTAAMSTAGTLSVTAVASGELQIGSQIYGTGVPVNTVITALGTGVGNTGTYTTNYTGVAIVSESMTADATTQVPNASVYRFAAAGGAGLGVIKLTN